MRKPAAEWGLLKLVFEIVRQITRDTPENLLNAYKFGRFSFYVKYFLLHQTSFRRTNSIEYSPLLWISGSLIVQPSRHSRI